MRTFSTPVHSSADPIEAYLAHCDAGAVDEAARLLALALQSPRYRADARVWQGIAAMRRGAAQDAFLYFAGAAALLSKRADVIALLGRSALLQQRADLAEQLLAAAWREQPLAPALRLALWQARAHCSTKQKFQRVALQALPEVTEPAELRLLAQLLKQTGRRCIGVIRYDASKAVLSGWAIDLAQPEHAARLQLTLGGRAVQVGAQLPDPLLTAAGISASHGGFQISAAPADNVVNAVFEDGTALCVSPCLIAAPFAPPPAPSANPLRHPVDILVPVYKGEAATLACIQSVLDYAAANRTMHRVVVLDDCSPEPALVAALAELARQNRIDYVRQPSNLGFIRNMNRGMALHPERDVVWLNADTRVHGNWLDRLRTAAYSADDIGSATPFSNNGELMSFPVSRTSHDMPDASTQAQIDDVASTLDIAPIEIETGCGFCLYVKRQTLTKVGYLDEVDLQRGYGEETDWCLRARANGWRHVGAVNLFVAHEGGLSFGDEKALRVHQNNTLLKQRYPGAEARFNAFCQRDPLHPARAALQRARLPELAAWLHTGSAHDWPRVATRQLQIAGPLVDGETLDAPLTLHFRNIGQNARATLRAELPALPLILDYQLPADAAQLMADIATLPVDEIVFRQLAALPRELKALPDQLAKPYRIVSCDDVLLTDDQHDDWPDFARNAVAVHLPWASLAARYARALPDANFEIASSAPNMSPSPLLGEGRGEGDPATYLVADHPLTPAVAQQWLTLARAITREALPIRLLLINDTPWTKELEASGAVYRLPDLDGLTISEALTLAGCQAALSLDPDPGAGWHAPAKAAHHQLPLFAPASPVAQEAGAQSPELLGLAHLLVRSTADSTAPHPSQQTRDAGAPFA